MSKSPDSISHNFTDGKIFKTTNEDSNIHTFEEPTQSFHNIPGRVVGVDALKTSIHSAVNNFDIIFEPTNQYARTRMPSTNLDFEHASIQPMSNTAPHDDRTLSIPLEHLICCHTFKILNSATEFTAKQLRLQSFLISYASKPPNSVAPPLTTLSQRPSIFAEYQHVLCIIQRRDRYDPVTDVPSEVDIRWYGLSSIEAKDISGNEVKVAYIHVGYSVTTDKMPKVVTKKDAEMHRKMCLIREAGLSLVCEQAGHGNIEWTAFFAEFQAERRILRLDGRRRSGAAGSGLRKTFSSGSTME